MCAQAATTTSSSRCTCTQSLHKFRDGSAIKITVTEYFRPNGERVNDIGITPDIEAPEGDVMDKALEELAK